MSEISESAESETAKAATDRLIFFSDAVVAIAITLLAIDLPVPTGNTDAELLASIRENGLDYLSFLISFVVIGNHWLSHHRVFRHVARSEGPVPQLSLVWLLLIVLTPFLTRVINEGDLDVVRFGMYALAQALQLIVFAAITWIIAHRGWYAPGAPEWVAKRGYVRYLVVASGFVVSIPLFLAVGPQAFWAWGLMPILLGRIGRGLGFLPKD